MAKETQGWQCPICKNVWAPNKEKCDECAKGLGGVPAILPNPIKPITPYKIDPYEPWKYPPPIWVYEPTTTTSVTATFPYTITTNAQQWGN